MTIPFNRKLIAVALGVVAIVFIAWMSRPVAEYEATTLVLIDPQKVPERLVPTTVSLDLPGRLNTIEEQLMSSTRLQRVIDTYDLYTSMKGHKTSEEIIQHRRKSIHWETIQTPDGTVRAFRLTYRGLNPALTAQVCNQLASLFIETNLKVREQQAEGTSEFLDTQLAIAKKAAQAEEAVLRGAKSAEDREWAARDLALLRDNYASLMVKKLGADMAADLEKHQKSERFTILDPARIPEKPARLRPHFMMSGL